MERSCRRCTSVVAPHATGTAVTIQESSRTIVGAFITAGILATVIIGLLLAVTLRRLHDVLLALAPLLLAGLLTLASTVVLGQKLDFANVDALPLLGISLPSTSISWSPGGRARRICCSLSLDTGGDLFFAATTATGFSAALCHSPHPGTASMGELLMICCSDPGDDFVRRPARPAAAEAAASRHAAGPLGQLLIRGIDLLHQARGAASREGGVEEAGAALVPFARYCRW